MVTCACKFQHSGDSGRAVALSLKSAMLGYVERPCHPSPPKEDLEEELPVSSGSALKFQPPRQPRC